MIIFEIQTLIFEFQRIKWEKQKKKKKKKIEMALKRL